MREPRMPPMVEKQSLEDALKDIPKWAPPPDEPKEPEQDNTGSTGSQRLDDALKDIPRYDPNAPEEPIPPEEPQPELPQVKVPNPPVHRKPPWKLIATVLAAVAFALKFTPVPAAIILALDWIVKILQAIPSG